MALTFKRDPHLRPWLVSVDTAETDYLFMNVEMKPFDNPTVRRALNYAINKERLVKLAGGFAIPARGIVPPSLPWSNPTLPAYEYSPEKARALLREAGYPNGFKTELWCGNDVRVFKPLAEGIEQDLRDIGIQVELRPMTYSAFQEKAQTRKQIALGVFGWTLDYPDASDFLDVLLNGERITDTDCNNSSFYNNPEVNRRLDVGISSMNNDERTRLFREAEDIVMKDAPWVTLIHEQVPVLYHPRLRGTAPHPVWLWRYEKMWFAN